MHELDAGMRTSSEYYTKANLGEVMPGSLSYLGSFLPIKLFPAAFQKYLRFMMGAGKKECCQYFEKGFGMTFNHCLFNMIDVFCRVGNENSSMYSAYSLGMFGRILNKPDMFKMAEVRFQDAQPSTWIKIRRHLSTIQIMLFAEQKFVKCAAKYKNYSVDLSRCTTAIAMYEEIERCWPQFFRPLACSGSCNTPSTLYNMLVMVALSKLHGGWTSEVYNSFALLLSSCDGVESADVPRSMQDLAYCISQDPEKAKFRSMDTKEALQWLKTSSGKSGIKFREFLLKHGHRCVKEFDIQSITWDMDSLPLVKTLQGMVDSACPLQKKETSVRKDLAKLGLKIPWTTWLYLQFLIPRCRHAVGLRERAKSLTIKLIHAYRHAYHQLAKTMVAEGFLPKSSLLFHLTHDEIRELLETRSPAILSKAYRREILHPKMDSMRFPEIMQGVPRPVTVQKTVDQENESLTMHGTAVCKGIAIGTARVVNCLQEAATIQKGDILIAYCTDTGWTPYFPLLSGVATELGGLISHGAVVAREYGLPCVIALHGATSVFHSGEKVILNGNKGTLSRLEE